MPDDEYAINRSWSRRHVRGEFLFRVVKRLWGLTIVRYRGLRRNTARGYALVALAKLYLV